jgi:hypothetical protein
MIRSNASPVISTVVRSVSTTERFDVLGREAQITESQFAYHDGYYEGIEQEFRGFGAADAVHGGGLEQPDRLLAHALPARAAADLDRGRPAR